MDLAIFFAFNLMIYRYYRQICAAVKLEAAFRKPFAPSFGRDSGFLWKMGSRKINRINEQISGEHNGSPPFALMMDLSKIL
jgi:hypothetical protein